jgi:hypothetical protein
MANEQNLKILSPNEAREFGRIGGIMSGQVRKERKQLREIALTLANTQLPSNYSIDRYNSTENYNLEKPTVIDGIMIALLRKSLNGNLQAIKILFNIIGDNPTLLSELQTGQTLTEQEVKVSYKTKKQSLKPI